MIREKTVRSVAGRHPRGVLMNTILVCDDDSQFVDYLSSEIYSAMNSMQRQPKIYRCNSAQDLTVQAIQECDIAFLDIDFAGKKYTGIDIARTLRKHSDRIVIIFVTNFPEYAPDGYEVHAFRYLLKSKVGQKLKPYLVEALNHVTAVKRTYQLYAAGETTTLPLDEVVYIESQLHMVNVYLKQKGKSELITKSFYAAISQLEGDLEKHGFLRIHKSYLVNMGYLEKYQCTKAVLSNGTMLKVSEKNYAVQKQKYLQWKGAQ